MSITAAPITYPVNETQMIAVITGAGGASLLEGGQLAAQHVARHNTARLLAFSLKGRAQLPDAASTQSPLPRPERFGSRTQLAKGKVLYDRYCARCHGEDTLNAGPLRDLKHSAHLADRAQWERVVFAGLLSSTGMPGFMAEITTDDAEALRAYVAEQAKGEHSPP